MCTKSFHKMANSHRRSNAIDSLLINVYMCTDFEAIKSYFVRFHEDLISKQFSWGPKLNGLLFGSIDPFSPIWL